MESLLPDNLLPFFAILGSIAVAIVAFGSFVNGLEKIFRYAGLAMRRAFGVLELLGSSAKVPRYLRKRGRITVGFGHYPPLCELSRDETGKLIASGPYPDLMHRICKANNLELDIRQIRWDALEHALVDSKCDAICPVFPTEARLKYALKTATVHTVSLGAIARREEHFLVRDTSDLNPKSVTIVVAQGEVGWEFVKTELPEKFSAPEENKDTQNVRYHGYYGSG